ncbi:MAG: type VI secretion system tip protein VgrG [Cyanobacteriota bacterium]|nr:type VI secretion system tip protein VgrG [Cyanobacteriota bacterium]
MPLPNIKIKCNGRPLPAEYEVLDLQVRNELNRVPKATLVLLDGSVAERRFAISDGTLFKPGSRITIALGYVDQAVVPKTVFDGIVIRHAIASSRDGLRLKLTLSDRTITMTRRRRSAVYQKKTDTDVIRSLIRAAKLKVGRLATTPITHPELVQFNVSDWDFMLARADVLGLAVRVTGGEVSLLPISLSTPKRTLNHGLDDTRALELQLDGGQQWSSLTVQAWDRAQLKPTAPIRARPPAISVGNSTAQALVGEMGAVPGELVHGAPTAPRELQAWADARLRGNRWALLRGSAVVDGQAGLQPLHTVEIKGVGSRFNGRVLVSAVTHSVNHDGWRTVLTFGLAPGWFARTPELAEVPAAGLLPPASGLQIATVASLAEDPQGELRVQVKLPCLDQSRSLLWARPMSPDAGQGRGFVFRPEVGDEVVIGFLNDDPRQPLILGSLFGSKNKPPKPVAKPERSNPMRAIVSRSGSRIVFDDKTPALHIETTAAGNANGEYRNRISIDEKAHTITIEDQHKNKIQMGSEGISIISAKDLNLSAKGEVKITADSNLQLEGKTKAKLKSAQLELAADSKLQLKSAQVDVAASASLSAKGAQTKLGGDALLELKAALVKIN